MTSLQFLRPSSRNMSKYANTNIHIRAFAIANLPRATSFAVVLSQRWIHLQSLDHGRCSGVSNRQLWATAAPPQRWALRSIADKLEIFSVSCRYRACIAIISSLVGRSGIGLVGCVALSFSCRYEHRSTLELAVIHGYCFASAKLQGI